MGLSEGLYIADPDTQRAMMKSYQESNGTVLSTNWKEVGTGEVEMKPPEGMEYRTYSS
jgi:suppressor of G2 allele of SKP1